MKVGMFILTLALTWALGASLSTYALDTTAPDSAGVVRTGFPCTETTNRPDGKALSESPFLEVEDGASPDVEFTKPLKLCARVANLAKSSARIEAVLPELRSPARNADVDLSTSVVIC